MHYCINGSIEQRWPGIYTLVIFISLLNTSHLQIGDLLKDWCRMNVSFTRARAKLIIFGSRKTLQLEPLLSEFFDLMRDRGWIFQLHPTANTMHPQVSSPITPMREEGSPGKRVAESKTSGGEENQASVRPTKKTKQYMAGVGVLKGRPILQDLVNEEK